MEHPLMNKRGAYVLPNDTPVDGIAQHAYEALRNAIDTGEGHENANMWYLTLRNRLRPGHRLQTETAELYRTEIALGAITLLREEGAIPQEPERVGEDLATLSEQLQTAILDKNRAKAVEIAYKLAATPKGIEHIMQGLEQIRKTQR